METGQCLSNAAIAPCLSQWATCYSMFPPKWDAPDIWRARSPVIEDDQRA